MALTNFFTQVFEPYIFTLFGFPLDFSVQKVVVAIFGLISEFFTVLLPFFHHIVSALLQMVRKHTEAKGTRVCALIAIHIQHDLFSP